MEDEEDWDEDDEAWEDEEPLTEEEHLDLMRANGVDTRGFDPRYVCLRRGDTYSRRSSFFVKRTTLNDPQRIERLRWKAYLNYQNHFACGSDIADGIIALGGECFIPVDWDELNADDELSEEQRERLSHPRRVYAEKSRHGCGYSINYDDRFWGYEEPRHSDTEMEVLAAAGALGEWEQITKPERVGRAKDPAKLALGARYRHHEARGWALGAKCQLLNEMLSRSIIMTGILPPGPEFADRTVRVHLNGRIYFLKVRLDYQQPEYERWPMPDDPGDVYPPAKFKIDNSLIGLRPEAVMTRFGEPTKKLRKGKTEVWYYPEGQVVFDGVDNYYARVTGVSVAARGHLIRQCVGGS